MAMLYRKSLDVCDFEMCGPRWFMVVHWVQKFEILCFYADFFADFTKILQTLSNAILWFTGLSLHLNFQLRIDRNWKSCPREAVEGREFGHTSLNLMVCYSKKQMSQNWRKLSIIKANIYLRWRTYSIFGIFSYYVFSWRWILLWHFFYLKL